MMTFLDGPAAGVANGLCLRRAPRFLRVVVDNQGKWDALDQIHDLPRSNETVYVYRLVSNDGTIHLNQRDKNGRPNGGMFVLATYRFVEEQPEAAIVRDNSLWQQWATAQDQSSPPPEPEV